MERRAAIKLITLAALAPKLSGLEAPEPCPMATAAVAAAQSSAYRLQFFTEEENALLDQLMEMIIPADGHSPGAHAAKTSQFADLMVASSEDGVRQEWRNGLRTFREQATNSSPEQTLEKAAANEGNPRTDLERFFALVKSMTVNGYYTSKIGIEQEMEYIGNTYVAEFPECTHPEHHE
jgi:hypothetical protein